MIEGSTERRVKMAKDESKYYKLREIAEHDGEFQVSVGSQEFLKPRLRLKFSDGEEVFLYFDQREMRLIRDWAESYQFVERE